LRKVKIAILIDDEDDNIPYFMACLDLVSGGIQNLTFKSIDCIQNCFKKCSQMLQESKELSSLVNGSWLDHTLKTCKALKVLNMVAPDFINLPYDTTHKNSSIQQLKL
jgi:hypothetical protein